MIATDRELEIAQGYLHEIRQQIETGDRYGAKQDILALMAAVDELQKLRDDRG